MIRSCYDNDIGNLQIKNIPDGLHERLRKRAAAEHVSQRDYVLRLVEADLRLPTMADWLEQLESDEPIDFSGSTADLVADAREQRDREVTMVTPRVRPGRGRRRR